MGSENSDRNTLPTGSPEWVTPELLADTLATWQALYAEPLTVADALEILLGVSRLCDVVQTFHYPEPEIQR